MALRLPAMFLQPGGQDEEYYAVPGLTILENGIPRLPHVPARNAESVFFRGEECLFAEPPLYFYLQAIFYAMLPGVYGTARLATAVSACVFLVAMYGIARRLGLNPRTGLIAVILFSVSRWFFFSAIVARPDMTCAMFGAIAIWLTMVWIDTDARRPFWHLVAIGVCIGLGGLTHMVAITYAIPIGVWILVASWNRWRWISPTIVTLTAILISLLWLVLIAQYPDVFSRQFGNQIFHGAGGSIIGRVVWPWRSLAYHIAMLWEHIGPWQCLLAISGVAGIASRRDRRWLAVVWIIAGTTWFIAALVGPHHPVYGYWPLPAALLFVGVGAGVDAIMTHGIDRRSFAGVTKFALGTLLAASMIPGSGLRTLVTHVVHRDEMNYDAPRFAAELLRRIPKQGTVAVDTQFVLDFIVAGRSPLMAETFPMYFRVDECPVDYLIVSRHGLQMKIAEFFETQLMWTDGIRDDPLACYVEVYRVLGPAKHE